MLEIAIPGRAALRLEHLLLDYNGTLAVDGALLPGVAERLASLARHLKVQVLTADTFRRAAEGLRDIPCELAILTLGNQAAAKRAYLEKVGAGGTAAIGNGRNDCLMLEAAAFGIAVVQGEGAAVATVMAADVVATDIAAALDLHDGDAVAHLSGCLQEAAQIDGVDRYACHQLAERLGEGTFNLVVAGEFKRGKSSLINALLGAPVLPVAVVPLTSVVTLIGWGETARATVCFLDGREETVALDAIADYATEKGNPHNIKGVDHVALAWTSDWLRGGIRLVDTPGIGSIHQHNTDVTYRYLPQADAVLFVAAIDQPVGRAEADFLKDIRHHAEKVICLLNKADHVSAAELAESLDFAARTVQGALGVSVPMIPVSARLMLAGKLEDNPELCRASGLPQLEAALKRLLGEERRAVWLASMTRNLRRILGQGRLATGLELAALAAPVEELDAKLSAFAAKKQETLQAMSDYAVLFDAGIKALLRDKVEPDLERFRVELHRTLAAGIRQRFEAGRHLRLKPLQADLEAWAVAAVRAAWDDWRAAEDAALAGDFAALCERFRHGIEAIVDALSSYSAELFQVPFEAIGGAGLRPAPADFYYKFWSEPGVLFSLGASLILLLPKFIGAPLILERATRYALELADTQSGRVRYNFDERLKKSAGDFRKEMRAGLEATIAGIETAVARGTTLRQQGEANMAVRRDALVRSRNELEILLEHVGSNQ